MYSHLPIIFIFSGSTTMSKDNSKRPSKSGLFGGYFVHGTSSCSLPGIKRTNFTLYPIPTMLRNSNRGPLCGEFTQGGYKAPYASGSIAFGTFDGSGAYDFQSIQSSYATSQNNSKNTLKTLKHQLKIARERAYSNIQIILIFLSRAKQLGLSTSHLIDLPKIERDIEAQIQLNYLLLLLDKHIFLDMTKFNDLDKETKETVELAILETVNHDALFEKLLRSKLDLKAIFENQNPTSDDLKPVLELLETPEPPFDSNYSWTPKRVLSLPYRQFFTSDSKKAFYPYNPHTFNTNSHNIDYALTSPTGFLQYMAGYYKTGKINQDEPFEEFVFRSIKAFKQGLQTLRIILAVDKKSYAITKKERKCFVEKPFPVIFLSDSKDIVPLGPSEHRAKKPLRLGIGKEISIVATDTAENQNTLKRFFKENGVDIVVIPFSLLRKEYINAGGHWYEPEPRSLLDILDEYNRHQATEFDFDFGYWQFTLKKEGRNAILYATYALQGLLALIAIAISPLLLLIRAIDTVVYKIRMSHYNQLHSQPEPPSIRPPSLSEAPLRRTKSTGSLLDTLVAYRQSNESDAKTSEGESCDTVDDCNATRTPPTLQHALTV